MVKVNTEKMEIVIGDEIEAAAERFLIELRKTVATMSNAGMSLDEIKATLARQATQSTGAMGELKKNLRTIATSSANRAANEGMYAEYRDVGILKYRWITVSAKPCPDCAERHGQVETLEDWELIGLPGSGFSVCQENCKCRLVPEDYKGKDLENPVIRKLKSPKGQAYAYYREMDVKKYVAEAQAAIVTANTVRRKMKKHPNFAGEMSYSERVDWVREKPDGVYFRLHKGEKQVVFVRGDHYVFGEDNRIKTAYIPADLDEYGDKRATEWIKIPEGKWKRTEKKS